MTTDEKLDILWGAEERIYLEIGHMTRFIAGAEDKAREEGVALLYLLFQCLSEINKGKLR